jgi:hypothetical protein
MFEKEIKFITDFTLNKISKAGTFLTFEKIRGVEIHPAILKFISADIDYQIFEDRQILLQKSKFNYSGNEISKYFKLISLEIKKTERIKDDEIDNLVDKAITFNFDYTTKPNETLLNLIFKNDERKTAEEILLKLDYLYYYNYLKQIISSYLDKKQLITMNREKFANLLNKIDEELVLMKPGELVDNALSAISDFFNVGAILRTQIPPQAFEFYLQEKKMQNHLTNLRAATEHNPKQKYDIDELKKIIYTLPPPAAEKEKSEENETPIEEVKNETVEEKVEITNELKPAEDESVKKDLAPEPPAPAETEKIEIEEIEIVEENSEHTVNLSEEMTIKEPTETIPLDPNEVEEAANERETEISIPAAELKKDILSYLSDRETEKIIGSIFNEDKEDFAMTIDAISECENYEKATEILKSLYTIYNINPYTHDAILLTNAIAKYFKVM